MVVITAAILVMCLLAGCGTSSSGTSSSTQGGSPTSATTPSTQPTPSTTPATTAIGTKAGTDTVSGTAQSADGRPVTGVAVGFQLATAPCSTCDLYKTLINGAGNYAIHLPSGTYRAQCFANGGRTCLIAGNPPRVAAQFDLTSNGTLNLLVVNPTPPPTAPSTTVQPNTPSGDVVSGHILTPSGQPVANASITFRMAGCEDCEPQPHTETGPDGSYSITLPPGVYNAECDVIGICGAQGTSGGGVPVQIPPGGTLNFIVCPSGTTFPQCTQQ